MKKNTYSILVICFALVIVLGCKDDESGKDDDTGSQLEFSGQLTEKTECKDNLKSTNTENTPDTISCVEYIFDEANNKLSLRHINAGFNCCQDKLYVETSLTGDTIIIQEYEVNPMCNCCCLFDLAIELDGTTARTYQIKFIEPYALEKQKILFEVDLANNTEGKYSITRKGYPWGE